MINSLNQLNPKKATTIKGKSAVKNQISQNYHPKNIL